MNFPIIVIGGGGHARVLIYSLLLQKAVIVGFTDPNPLLAQVTHMGIKYLGDDSRILEYDPNKIKLVNALGSTSSSKHRRNVYEANKKLGFDFASVIHPSAIISEDALLSEGVQIMAGAVIQPGVHVGANTIINTRASIDHDCQIGAHAHIAPGAVLSGGVTIMDNVHVGTGAVVIQQVKINDSSIIGAGAVVLKDVPANRTYVGVPAKDVQKQ